jgi:hypothetical protein
MNDFEAPWPILWGRRLIVTGLSCLLVGKALVKLAEAAGWKLSFDDVLPFLIPVWFISIGGILLALFGWAASPDWSTELDSHCRSLRCSFPTRVLASLLCLVVALACIALVIVDDVNPRSVRGTVAYCLMTCSVFILYLCWGYHERQHRATTTYLNSLTPVIAFPLIPVTWFLLVYFNWQLLRKSPTDDIR